jgi:hypothetical protein
MAISFLKFGQNMAIEDLHQKKKKLDFSMIFQNFNITF